MLSTGLSTVSVDDSISACLMGTVCFGSKYCKSMSSFVKTNEDYLLSTCARSQTSVTFYDAYLWSKVSPFEFYWQSFPKCHTEHSKRLLKVQDGCTRSDGGFSQKEKCSRLGVCSAPEAFYSSENSKNQIWLRCLNCFSLNRVCFWPPVPVKFASSRFYSIFHSLAPSHQHDSILPLCPEAEIVGISPRKHSAWSFLWLSPLRCLSLRSETCLLAVLGPHRLVGSLHTQTQTHKNKPLHLIWCSHLFKEPEMQHR